MNSERKIGLLRMMLWGAVFIVICLVFAANAADETADLDEALNLEPDLENGIDAYEVCAACHLPEGSGNPDGTFPQLAGQHVSAILNELRAFRMQQRIAPTMYPYALARELGGAQDVADVAAYISQLPISIANGKGPGASLEEGEKLYQTKCVACHGQDGAGNAAAAFPRIHAQHYEYVVRQILAARDGQRKGANAGMVAIIKDLSDAQVKAVADYVSRLKPPEDRIAPEGWENPDYQ